MLVLGRREGERILLDNGIIITIVETRPGSCRVGIEAPRAVGVAREEILGYTEIAQIEELAASGSK